MIRINTVRRYGSTVTLELMGHMGKTELLILRDCLQSHGGDGVREVHIIARELRSLDPTLRRDALSLRQLGLRVGFEQLSPSVQNTLRGWGRGLVKRCVNEIRRPS